MKIAFFSDVHANLPALQAVFEDIEIQNPDVVYCLGDLVGYNIWPNEVIQEIRRRKIPTIAGNYDYGIGRSSDDCGCAYKSDDEKAMGAISIAYTNSIIEPAERAYLHGLPAHIALDFGYEQNRFRILMVHGSPRKINEYLFEDRTEKSLERLMLDAGADVMLFGHTHKPYHKVWEAEMGTEKSLLHAINIGAVGKPKDGDPRACYVIMEIDPTLGISSREGIQVSFRRVGYDVERAAQAVEQSPLPNGYAEMLRKAR